MTQSTDNGFSCAKDTIMLAALFCYSGNVIDLLDRYDLTFNLPGYVMVFISDIATALNGVYTMKKLQSKVSHVW